MGTPSAQTLVDVGVNELFQELEEVPRTMVGGLDVHRRQITFDYVDDDGLVHWGRIRPATRQTLRGWRPSTGLWTSEVRTHAVSVPPRRRGE
jgi:hypothetical protein